MTIIKDIKERTIVKFAKKTGCPRCQFLDNAINNSDYSGKIKPIYLEDYDRDAFMEIGVMSTPVVAIVENGEIVKRDPNVITGEQLEAFLAE